MSMASEAFKYFIKLGKQIFGTNSQKIANDLQKQGGRRVPKNQIKADTKVTRAPSVPNPRSSAGKFTSPKPPTKPKPSKPTVSANKRKAPAKPSASGSSVTSGSKPNKLPTKPSRPSVSTKAPSQPTKPKTMPKNMVKERPNLPPKPKSGNPAKLRGSTTVGSAPEIDMSPVAPKTKPTNKSGEMPKSKKEEKKKSSGSMSLRQYLNEQIKKRGSTLTAEKKKASKYKSIAAAKKGGSLYYTNKNGKIMAAVYKEDLKK